MLFSPDEIFHRHHHPPIVVHKGKIWKMPFAHDLYKLIHRVIFANTMDKGRRFKVSVPVPRFRPTACPTNIPSVPRPILRFPPTACLTHTHQKTRDEYPERR